MVGMTPQQLRKLQRELATYSDYLTDEMGRPERRRAMGHYLKGLLLDGKRKSIEPMAARLVTNPNKAEAMRQRLQQCVVVSPWAEEELFRRVAVKVDRELPGIEALVVDDTGFAKKGEHSVGVARQYSGTLARIGNCQVATSLHLAGEKGSACIGMRLYLPTTWTDDRERCAAAGVPSAVKFQRKWEIALQQIDDAIAWGVRKHVALADAGYGDVAAFRDGLTERGLKYVVGISHNTAVYPPDAKFAVPCAKAGKQGRRATRMRTTSVAVDVKALALKHEDSFRKVTWRAGTKGPMQSYFFACRVRTAHGHSKGNAPGPEQWALWEWPEGKVAPTKFWLSSLPKTTSLKQLVRLAKLRWRIERDYQELKGEIGLDHFEGRQWRGFHHHAALCAAAHAFLALRRALFPPQETTMDSRRGAP